VIPDSPVGIEDGSRSAGAPVNEIEITPEMVEAGVRAFCSFRSGMETPDEVVEEVFKKMISAKNHDLSPFALRLFFC
jgi:hypothetical protein